MASSLIKLMWWNVSCTKVPNPTLSIPKVNNSLKFGLSYASSPPFLFSSGQANLITSTMDSMQSIISSVKWLRTAIMVSRQILTGRFTRAWQIWPYKSGKTRSRLTQTGSSTQLNFARPSWRRPEWTTLNEKVINLCVVRLLWKSRRAPTILNNIRV